MNKKYAVKIIGGTGDIGAICYKGFDFNGTWFNNKEDAEEFKSMLEYVNKGSSYEIISREKEIKMAPVEQTSEHRHPHADMIIEWVEDTSKVVEYYYTSKEEEIAGLDGLLLRNLYGIRT